jgi:hypothetical protein
LRQDSFVCHFDLIKRYPLSYVGCFCTREFVELEGFCFCFVVVVVVKIVIALAFLAISQRKAISVTLDPT